MHTPDSDSPTTALDATPEASTEIDIEWILGSGFEDEQPEPDFDERM